MPPTTVLVEEGSMTEPSYPSGDATQGAFSFGASGFCVDDTCRESGTSLKRLLFPELLKSDEARNSAQAAAGMIDRPWTKAQLQHYGINFSPKLDPFKAKALLLTSVAQGLCDAVPPQILNIKATLKEEYKGMMEDYRNKMKAYRVQELPKRIQAFEACPTPTEEAECDKSLFLRKYFLDKDGNPDRTKTPDLILLPGYYDRGLALTGRTERVPALHVADGGREGASNVLVIGWDRTKVNAKAHDIDMHQTDGRGILRSSQDWNILMSIHHSYMKKHRSQAKTSDPKTGTSFDICNLIGKYVVKSDYIQHGWPVVSKQLRLRFISGGRLAIFDLGIIVGLMVLGKTQVAITKLVQDGNWNADLIGVEEMDDDSESEDVSKDEEDSYDERESGCSDESDAPGDLISDRPVKRQRIENGHPRRLYFQWRGYDTVSGAIKSDPLNCNTGHLDFTNDDATTFEGFIRVDARISTDFQGYKVPGLAGPLTMDWNALSHLASERAKAPEHVW